MVNTPATPAPRSTMATWGLVCGIVGVVGVVPFVPLFEYVFAPAAIVLGILGFREVSRGMRGRAMCIAAIALGVLALAVAIARMVAAS